MIKHFRVLSVDVNYIDVSTVEDSEFALSSKFLIEIEVIAKKKVLTFKISEDTLPLLIDSIYVNQKLNELIT